jgi:chromosome segregation ATPase
LEADNPFDTVLEEIKKMIVIIDEEAKADLEQKEWCESEREEYHKRKEDTERAIADLEETITTLDDEINNPETGLLKMIADTEESLIQNHDSQTEQTTDRGKENRLYQENIKNIQVTKELLGKAIEVLKAYYAQFNEEEAPEGEEAPSFVQQLEEPERDKIHGREVPTTWDEEYKGQSEQGGDVIKTLEFIKEESHKEETDAHQAENDAQHEFEDSMKDLKEEQATLEESLAKFQLKLAETEKALAENKEELKKTEEELKAIKAYIKKIKPGCDYIAENYEEREKNRNLEKDALSKATDMLKATPAYKKAVIEQEQEDLGKCKDICNEEGRDHAKCEACLAGTSVPGYCAGHAGTPGC